MGAAPGRDPLEEKPQQRRGKDPGYPVLWMQRRRQACRGFQAEAPGLSQGTWLIPLAKRVADGGRGHRHPQGDGSWGRRAPPGKCHAGPSTEPGRHQRCTPRRADGSAEEKGPGLTVSPPPRPAKSSECPAVQKNALEKDQESAWTQATSFLKLRAFHGCS